LFQAYNKHAFNNPFQPHLDNPMKKLLILALALAPAVVSAQETANVAVSTTIRAAFTISQASDLVFGQVQAEDVVTVNALTGAITNTGSSATRGKVTSTATGALVYTISTEDVNASYNTGTQVFTVPRTSGASGATDIEVTLSFAVDETDEVSYTPGSSTGATDADGNTLWIGGTFTAPTAASIGNVYSSTIKISAVYL
jgi:hypothetical protein